MDFVIRGAVESDFDQALALVTDRFLYDAVDLRALRRMWLHLISARCGVTAVLADEHAPSRVFLFANSVFVENDVAARYHSLASPGIGCAMVRDWNAGKRPFLTRDEIGRANAGDGLNIVVTHHGLIEPVDEESKERLRTASYELSMMSFRGWNMRSYTNEVFAENPLRDGKQMGEALGFRLGRYSDDQLMLANIPPHKAPWVWMATREDAAGGPVGVALGVLFRSFSPPRFGLGEHEQDVLQLALAGLTDESISRITATSLTTTKKRFRTAYGKMLLQSSDWESPLFSEPSSDGVRGAEVRRRLLNYLRAHPEELRPYTPQPAAAQR